MKVLKKISLASFILAAASGVLLLALIFYFSSGLPTTGQIANRQISQSTKIYDRTGAVLLYEISGEEQRTVVSLQDMPRYLKDAAIAVEDENFYNEPAFDWRGIARAVFVNFTRGKILQGGSTITQQLARSAFLTTEQTIARKIKELILAIRINRRYSKDQILELYLNQIPYGPTLYGVEAASEGYFNKSVKDITLAESALLAALPKAPTYYSPWGNHVKELLNREQSILKKMLSLGKISGKEYDEASKFKIVFAPQGRGIKAPHFVMAVQDYLVQKYGEGMVREGGLRVTTTLDWNMQQLAEKVVEDGAATNEKLYKGKNAALVAEDPKTGQILAMVGSRDYFDVKNEGNFNVATQGLRQPGSSLKPFVYLTAFKEGYTPETVVFDAPTEFAANNPSCPPIPNFDDDNKECFHPENFDGQFRGPVSLRQALAQSINIPAVKVLYLAGLVDSVKNARDFGLTTLTSPNLYGLSLVLGGGAVRLVDLVGAYSVLAGEGVKHDEALVLEVKNPKGGVLESYKDQNKQIADAQSVRLVNNILSDADARSGLFHGGLYLTTFPEHDVALKTGTSNDYRDAWAVGYTPSLVVGVWAGNNDNSPMQKHGSSILAAVPIWHAFMAEVVKNLPLETFGHPDPVSPQKPILAGDYLHDKQIHSILYYVDRKNPVGPPPQDPGGDPQFNNWESSVLAWAQANMPNFKDYNQPIIPGENSSTTSQTPLAPPKIKIEEPIAGSFIRGPVGILARITGASAPSKVNIYFNSKFIQDIEMGQESNYELRWSFSPQNLAPQNLLEVEAINQNGSSSRSGVIIYSR